MGNYTIFQMFENPRRGRQARNFTTNVPKILDLKSSSYRGKPWAFDYLLCPGRGECDLCLRGVGKIEPGSVRFQIIFFSGAEVANSYKTRVWTRWKSLKEEM